MVFADEVIKRLPDFLQGTGPWLSAAVFAVVGLALGFLVRRAVLGLGLPMARRTRTAYDEIVVESLAGPLAWSVVVLGLALAARTLDPAFDTGRAHDNALVTALLLVWGWSLASLLAKSIRQTSKAHAGHAHARGSALVARFSKVFVLVIVFLLLLRVWDVDVTPLLASAGLVGIAFALAAQDTLSNMFAGVAIYLDRLFEVGDVIVLDEGGSRELRGRVVDIGLRSTRVRTRDDVLIVVPNAVVANGLVVNESGGTRNEGTRVRVTVDVAYGTDPDQVERVLTQIGLRHELARPTPEPRARLRSFAESGIRWELLVWIDDPFNRGLVVHELSKAILHAFREERITIPFPQRDVRIVEAPPGRP